MLHTIDIDKLSDSDAAIILESAIRGRRYWYSDLPGAEQVAELNEAHLQKLKLRLGVTDEQAFLTGRT